MAKLDMIALLTCIAYSAAAGGALQYESNKVEARAAYEAQERAESAPRADYAAVPDDGDYMVVRVVGYDCQGAGDMLLASDEDQLPKCARIEAVPAYAVPLSE